MPSSIERLVAVMQRLRGPDGCPWDREQNFRSLRPFVLEEAYEVAHAIDEGDPDALRDELGDLLLQVVFHAQLASEQQLFDFAAVAAGIEQKLIRRHPHVFRDTPAGDANEAWARWDAIKAEERAARGAPAPTSRLDGVSNAQPALARAAALAARAARAGFDWPTPAAVCDKLEEETLELRAALAGGVEAQIAEELGDLLFAAVSLARKLAIDPEACLEAANRKFTGRFQRVEARAAALGEQLEELSPERLDQLWRQRD